MESEAQDAPEVEDATAALSRIEQALERIGQLAQADRSDETSGRSVAAGINAHDMAGRLDGLISKLRGALADRPGQD